MNFYYFLLKKYKILYKITLCLIDKKKKIFNLENKEI